MTVATNTMSILVRQAPPQTVDSSHASAAPPSADETARRLAALVARGDDAAFQQLYDLYQNRLLRLSLMLTRGDESLAADTVQAVFITAARKLRGAESESHLWHWLARVTRQHIAKAWRQRGKDSTLIGMEDLPDVADEKAVNSALEENLDAALQMMATDERQLIESFYFDQRSHKEIAEQLNVTPKAVSSRLERAREKLRTWMMKALIRET